MLVEYVMVVLAFARKANVKPPIEFEPSAVQTIADPRLCVCAWLPGSVHPRVTFTVAAAEVVSQFSVTTAMYAALEPPVVKSVVEPMAATCEVLVSVPTFNGKLVIGAAGVVHVGVTPIPAEVVTCPEVPGEPASVREPALNSSATVSPVSEVADR